MKFNSNCPKRSMGSDLMLSGANIIHEKFSSKFFFKKMRLGAKIVSFTLLYKRKIFFAD